MTPADDVRKLRERLDALHNAASDATQVLEIEGILTDAPELVRWDKEIYRTWPEISCALAALERGQDQPDATPTPSRQGSSGAAQAVTAGSASDPTAPAPSESEIVWEIETWIEYIPDGGSAISAAMKECFQRARDEIVRLEGKLALAAALVEREGNRNDELNAAKAQLAAQAPVIEAARVACQSSLGQWKPTEWRTLCATVRSLDAKEGR